MSLLWTRRLTWVVGAAMLLAACAASPSVPTLALAPTEQPTAGPTTVAVPPRGPSLPLVPPVEPSDPVAQALAQELPDDGAVEIAQAQQQLTNLRYYAGPIDGLAGRQTTTAVQAFQKVQGLPIDGELNPATIQALAAPVLPGVHQGEANRIDIDLDDQVMFVTINGRLERILPISSGNGDPYNLPGGVRAESLTPVGTFAITRRLPGTISAYFGRLTNPMYFHQGWAIHGSNNVPATPASHGCVRIPTVDAEWLFAQSEVGMRVNVYGSRNAFNPAAGETAGTTVPAGDPGPPPPPPPPPQSPGVS